MNQAVGPNRNGDAGGNGFNDPGQGQWLPYPTFMVYLKETDITHQGPANLWVLTDENADSINDSGFAFAMPTSGSQTEWIDMPSLRHGGKSKGFNFADGHSEIHEWRVPIPMFTIGFTKKTAEQFFEKLRAAGVQRILDVRLNNTSQLAGFSKRDDLSYFLTKILKIEYVPAPLLAPTQSMLDAYKKRRGGWEDYERDFLRLMKERRIEEKMDPSLIAGGCLLCSEETPHHCHRRLVAEYLQRHWPKLSVTHL